MARAKKDGVYLNVRIETPIYKKLQEVCEEAGQLKTTVVERALAAYFEHFCYAKRSEMETY